MQGGMGMLRAGNQGRQGTSNGAGDNSRTEGQGWGQNRNGDKEKDGNADRDEERGGYRIRAHPTCPPRHSPLPR